LINLEQKNTYPACNLSDSEDGDEQQIVWRPVVRLLGIKGAREFCGCGDGRYARWRRHRQLLRLTPQTVDARARQGPVPYQDEKTDAVVLLYPKTSDRQGNGKDQENTKRRVIRFFVCGKRFGTVRACTSIGTK